MVIVTSGAVGVGCQRLGLATKPSQLAKKQALAAVGQVGCKGLWDRWVVVTSPSRIPTGNRKHDDGTPAAALRPPAA